VDGCLGRWMLGLCKLLSGCCYAVVRWKLECFGWVVAKVLLYGCGLLLRCCYAVAKWMLGFCGWLLGFCKAFSR